MIKRINNHLILPKEKKVKARVLWFFKSLSWKNIHTSNIHITILERYNILTYFNDTLIYHLRIN